jgi:hypothetical protein
MNLFQLATEASIEQIFSTENISESWLSAYIVTHKQWDLLRHTTDSVPGKVPTPLTIAWAEKQMTEDELRMFMLFVWEATDKEETVFHKGGFKIPPHKESKVA